MNNQEKKKYVNNESFQYILDKFRPHQLRPVLEHAIHWLTLIVCKKETHSMHNTTEIIISLFLIYKSGVNSIINSNVLSLR